MQSLAAQVQGPIYTTQPLSPGSPNGEGDWQTFTQVLCTSAPVSETCKRCVFQAYEAKFNLMWWQVGGTAPSSAETELAMRVNEMWFIEPGGEPLTFREVFLKSSALENIIAGGR